MAPDQQHPPPSALRIISFFLITCSLSWTAWIFLFAQHLSHLAGIGLWLYLSAVAAPHISAALNTALESGRGGLVNLYSRMGVRQPVKWAIIAISVPPIIYFVRDTIALCFHVHHDLFFHKPPRTLPMLLVGQLAVVLGEELGWRGYALPRLMEIIGAIVGTLVLGIAWACWHLPLFLIVGTPQHGTPFLPFVILLTAWSMIMTFLVKSARGNIIPAMFFHASANICAFTMWEPDSYVFNLGPWIVSAAIAALLIERKSSLRSCPRAEI